MDNPINSSAPTQTTVSEQSISMPERRLPKDLGEAFNLIDQACSKFKGDRFDHQMLIKAIEIIAAAVQPSKEVPEQPTAPSIEG